MQSIDMGSFVRIDFEILWNSTTATHRERYLARKVNIWRDVFPMGMKESLIGLKAGDSISLDYSAGQVVSPYSQNNVKRLPLIRFQPQGNKNQVIKPYLGRFYPKGFLSSLIGIYADNYYPFRIIELSDREFVADLNHPLAQYPLEIKATVLEIAEKDSEFGGKCTVWMETIGDCGPGMQARWQNQATDFQTVNLMSRVNEDEDSLFYQKPRLVGHVDDQASSFLAEEYSRFLQPGMRVLDLMSSVQSHLPKDMGLEVIGLGLNKEEMDNNPQITQSVVYDLNADPRIPFADADFDAVICSLSIEYLIYPEKIIKEIKRLLRQKGVCLISFSNRWFPPKVTALWTELHEFERLGLVQEYMLQIGAFYNLQTYSVRNWWRPETDLRYPELVQSDPVFVVSGLKKDRS